MHLKGGNMEQSVEVSCAAVSAAAISEETEREKERGKRQQLQASIV